MNSKKSCLAILVLLFTIPSLDFAWGNVEGVIGDTALDQNPNLAMALPDTDQSEILISRQQYLISYNKNRRSANWVSWKLEANQIGNSGRTDVFSADSDLENYLSQNSGGFQAVQPTDYEKSCFDRGHQIPSADRTDNADNNAATFVMSNMIPQTPYLNRVIWEHLEAYTRTLVQRQGKKVFVMAGPIYDADFGSIGPNRDIPVPSKDFKIVFILDRDQTAADITADTPSIAVIMPNVLQDGSQPVPYTKNCGAAALRQTFPTPTIGNNTKQASMTWKARPVFHFT